MECEVAYGIYLSFEIVQILIESIAIKLNTCQFVDRRSSDSQRFLKAFKNSFTISINGLNETSPKIVSQRFHRTRKSSELTLSSLPTRPTTSVCHHK
jgi:hypothetical protein